MFKKLYKIFKGKPTDGPAPRGKWTALIKDMAVGDSVLVANRKEAERLRTAAYAQKKNISTRTMPDGTMYCRRIV